MQEPLTEGDDEGLDGCFPLGASTTGSLDSRNYGRKARSLSTATFRFQYREEEWASVRTACGRRATPHLPTPVGAGWVMIKGGGNEPGDPRPCLENRRNVDAVETS